MNLVPSEKPAVVIFAFKRAQILSQTLEKLSLSRRIDEFDIYVHVDYPKTESEMDEHFEVLKTIDQFSTKLSYKAVEVRNNHMGLRKSVISFLSALAIAHRYIIVLEDDIIVAEDFLDYQLECLKQFEFVANIGSVSGTRFEKFRHTKSRDILLSKRHSSWGWGTWGKTLTSIDWEILEDPCRLPTIQKTVSKVGQDLNNLINLHLEQKIDSWSIIFDTNMIVNKKYCIHPRYQKIQNIGFYSGTHFNNPVALEKSHTPAMENEYNRVGEIVSRGVKYDFIVKLKRNSKSIAQLVKLYKLIVPKVIKP